MIYAFAGINPLLGQIWGVMSPSQRIVLTGAAIFALITILKSSKLLMNILTLPYRMTIGLGKDDKKPGWLFFLLPAAFVAILIYRWRDASPLIQPSTPPPVASVPKPPKPPEVKSTVIQLPDVGLAKVGESVTQASKAITEVVSKIKPTPPVIPVVPKMVDKPRPSPQVAANHRKRDKYAAWRPINAQADQLILAFINNGITDAARAEAARQAEIERLRWQMYQQTIRQGR